MFTAAAASNYLQHEQSFIVKLFLLSEFSSASHNIDLFSSKTALKGHYASFWVYDRIHCHDEKK